MKENSVHSANEPFVQNHSIVREIWGKADTILFIFAGSAAEFAANKAVDWLYYTGRLPADPLGRLFSTVGYARDIVFASREHALQSIDSINAIHAALEKKRQIQIPDWAYRDVLFMLIHYSIAAFELLERRLTYAEKQEVFDVFYRVGKHMHLKNLPQTYSSWLPVRQTHLQNDLKNSDYTQNLYQQYKKHLGSLRFSLLRQAQKLVLPKHVKQLLGLTGPSWLAPVVPVYKISKKLRLEWIIKSALLPPAYKEQINALDRLPDTA